MPIYHKKVNGRKVWLVRVKHRALTASRVCETKAEARQAEAELILNLKRKIAELEQHGHVPATMKDLFEVYAADMRGRGKGGDSVARVEYTTRTVEALVPEFLAKPVGEL